MCVSGYDDQCIFIDIVTRAWPSKGSIVLNKVSIKYDENLEPVINNVSLHIPPGQKVKFNKLKLRCYISIILHSRLESVAEQAVVNHL